MIDSVASSFETLAVRRKPDRDPSAASFSYARASAALEKNAGLSLKIHGGKPEGQPASPGPATKPARDAAGPARAAAERPAADAADASPGPQAHATLAPVAATAPVPPAPAAPAPQQSSAVGTPQPQAAPTAGAAMAAVKPAAPAGAASGETPRTQAATQKLAAPAATAPLKSPEDFAELIARRLDDGATEFDLRLDPPELGRIEARLTVGDDGAAELRIKFDNQAAYDLFARDEAALRLAFADAGYGFGGGALAFVLDERAPARQVAPAPPAENRPYVALVAARALDVRV